MKKCLCNTQNHLDCPIHCPCGKKRIECVKISKKKTLPRSAIKINEDVWFYCAEKSFSFVVWAVGRDNNKVCTQFRIKHNILKKYM